MRNHRTAPKPAAAEARPAKVNRIAHLEAVAPPVHPAEALRRSVLHAFAEGVEAGDTAEVVKNLAQRARSEDRAADTYLRHLHAFSQLPAGAREQQSKMDSISQARVDLAHMLEFHGPLADGQLYQQAGGRLFYSDILAALNHPWFVVEAGKWTLTSRARAEVPGLPK